MKKILLSIFACSSLVFASAQVQFGVKAGYNLASVSQSGSQNDNGLKSKSGFHGGVFASLPIAESFFLQPELVYSGQGASETQNNETINLNYNYLNIPVLAKYQSAMGLFAETGPQVGFLLSANVSGGGVSMDIKDQSQSIDFSWAFGVGYKLSNIPLGIDARYNLGFTNILKDSPDETVKNSVFQIGLFYMFGGGSK
jgi:hypothetical protein